MPENHYITVLLTEYGKLISVQKEAKDRFFRIASLHNSAIAAGMFWCLEKYEKNSLFEMLSSTRFLASLSILLIMNALLISGSFYQIYSFFTNALHMTDIRCRIALKIGDDLFASEKDLGRFPDLGVWLSKRSEAFPVIMWFGIPIFAMLFGIYFSFYSMKGSPIYLWFLFGTSAIYSIMTFVYGIGLILWYRKVSQEERKITSQYLSKIAEK